MLLITHILIASFGLLGSLYSLVRASKVTFITTYILIALGVISGISLVVFQQASIVRVCSEGLLVSSISLAIAVIAQKRAATANIEV